MARVFAHALASRTLESIRRFDEAFSEVEHALREWDHDFGPTYRFATGYPGLAIHTEWDDLPRSRLELRASQLRESRNTPEGDLLERGRWLVDHGKPTEALLPLEQVVQTSREARTVAAARFLIHHARLRRALDLATANPTPDIGAALAELDLIASDEYDAGVLAARLAKATLAMQGGTGVDTLMQEALAEWRSHQFKGIVDTATPVTRDLAAIRDVLFQAEADAEYGRWVRTRNRQRRSPAPFVVVNPRMRVKFANGTEATPLVYEGLGTLPVLFLTASQLSLLREVHTRLEDNVSGRVRMLWNRFFSVGVSMGATLILQSPPVIGEVEFLDANGTRAAARFSIRSEGCTVILEKDRDGVWKTVRLMSCWIA